MCVGEFVCVCVNISFMCFIVLMYFIMRIVYYLRTVEYCSVTDESVVFYA